MRGVILDVASLGGHGLDLAPLLARLDGWEIHDATADAAVRERITAAEVVLSNKVVLSAADIAAATRLKLVVVMATGTNNVDLDAARDHGVAVCNVRDYASASVAEHTLLLMLALVRNLVPNLQSVQAGAWSSSRFFCLHEHPLGQLRGARLGIIGGGALGREVARLAAAFGMEVAYAALAGREHKAGIARMPLAELLAWLDVLSIHCPLNEDTRNLIGAAELARMRPQALLINTARGGIVHEAALLAALQTGVIAGAALDTLEHEPPPTDDPLLRARLPNLLITPHIAWAARPARQLLVQQICEIIDAFVAGSPLNQVNPWPISGSGRTARGSPPCADTP